MVQRNDASEPYGHLPRELAQLVAEAGRGGPRGADLVQHLSWDVGTCHY